MQGKHFFEHFSMYGKEESQNTIHAHGTDEAFQHLQQIHLDFLKDNPV